MISKCVVGVFSLIASVLCVWEVGCCLDLVSVWKMATVGVHHWNEVAVAHLNLGCDHYKRKCQLIVSNCNCQIDVE